VSRNLAGMSGRVVHFEIPNHGEGTTLGLWQTA
jgi:hypothetical protein